MLQSNTLGLNLSQQEVEDVYLLADANGDGLISYREFIPVLKKVLRIVYQRTTLDWNDWCQVLFHANMSMYTKELQIPIYTRAVPPE